jgi:antitoxin FitA
LAQLLIRKLPEDVKAALKRRAARRGVSMETEARALLESALLTTSSGEGQRGVGTRAAALFAGIGFSDGEFERIDSDMKVIDFGDAHS